MPHSVIIETTWECASATTNLEQNETFRMKSSSSILSYHVYSAFDGVRWLSAKALPGL